MGQPPAALHTPSYAEVIEKADQEWKAAYTELVVTTAGGGAPVIRYQVARIKPESPYVSFGGPS